MAEAAKNRLRFWLSARPQHSTTSRHSAELENDRAEFEKLLHRVIKEDKIDLVARRQATIQRFGKT